MAKQAHDPGVKKRKKNAERLAAMGWVPKRVRRAREMQSQAGRGSLADEYGFRYPS